MEQALGAIQPCSDEEQDHDNAHHGRSDEEEDGHWDQSDHNLLSNVKKTSIRSNYFDEGEGGRRSIERTHQGSIGVLLNATLQS